MAGNVYLTLLAVTVSFVGNFINAVGFIYQKMGHMRVQKRREKAKVALLAHQLNPLARWPYDGSSGGLDAKDTKEELEAQCMDAERNTFLAEPIWVFGFVIYVVGSLMHVAALGFGSQALLMPLEGVTLVANAMLAPRCLGEQLPFQALLGTGIIIFGITITVVFGPHSTITYTASEMLSMLSEVPFLLWTVFCSIVSIVVFVAMRFARARNKASGVIMKGDLNDMMKPGARIMCFAYCWLAGLFSSAAMLTAKQTMELLKTTIWMGDNQFTTVIPFVILSNFAMMNFLLEYWKQQALATFSALIVVPLLQVLLLVLSVLGGAIYFDEFQGLAIYRGVCFTLGLLVVVAGIVVLAVSGNQPKMHPGRTVFAAAFAVMTARRMVKELRRRQAATQHPKQLQAAGIGSDGEGIGAAVAPHEWTLHNNVPSQQLLAITGHDWNHALELGPLRGSPPRSVDSAGQEIEIASVGSVPDSCAVELPLATSLPNMPQHASSENNNS